ncbi:hypothetical protein ACIPSA_51285 [Streptomyces sp. NPDC086549]|uniref:hypothetical protein n=1 Tax=Streptomyces sp. NPDC086549 TaxID=3365752 RepID=UPI0038274BAE
MTTDQAHESTARLLNPYVTCLDLASAGAVVTTGWERTVQKTGERVKGPGQVAASAGKACGGALQH